MLVELTIDPNQRKDKKGYCYNFKTRLDRELNQNEAWVMGQVNH